MQPNGSPFRPDQFLWAAGIEDTFIVHTRPGLRRLDEYELTQHYQFWKADLDLAAESGARFLRWGIPWYRVQPEINRWDWSWTDEVLDDMVNRKGITPILDLMHYGTPGWLDNSFINHSYPQRVAEYAAEVARRYGSLVKYYTPFNEPVLNADWSGRKGVWPPYLQGVDGMVKVLLGITRGMVLTTRALRAEQPTCVTVQADALWKNLSDRPELQEQVAGNNLRRFLALDITSGRLTASHPLAPLLMEMGITENDLAWFADNAVEQDVIGANFYPWSYGQVYRDSQGQLRRLPGRTDGHAIAEILLDAYQRYGRPVMVTETSARGDLRVRSRWMDESIDAVFALRRDGIPVVGYTWFPLFSMLNWSYRTGRRPLATYLIHLGLYEISVNADGIMERRPTSLVEQYRRHTESPVPPVAEGRAK